MSSRPRDDRSLRRALLVAAVAVGAQTTLHLVDVFALGGTFKSFDADSDHGLAAAAMVVACGSAALAALMLSLGQRGRRDAVVLAALALALGFLAIDRITGLHDRPAYWLASVVDLPRVGAWPTPLVYAPLLGPAALILWTGVAGRASRRTARAGVVVLGLALALRVVALAAELVFGHLSHDSTKQVALAAKQGLQLGGWVLIAGALLAAVAANESAEDANVVRFGKPRPKVVRRPSARA
jgi:hypothetical protein